MTELQEESSQGLRCSDISSNPSLKNLMDLLKSELGSSGDTRVTSTVDGKELIGIEAERVSDKSEVSDQETTIPTIQTEPNEGGVPVEQQVSTYKRRKDICFETPVITSEPMSLNDLPDEILLHILSYFGTEDLCLIAKVSERLNVLAKDAIQKTLSYTCDRSSDISHIKKVLTNSHALHSLIIHQRNDAARILEFLFRNRGYLRKLIVKHCSLGDDSTGLLANIVALYPDLESLSLESCHPLTSDGYTLIPRLKKLSELNLSYCKGLSGQTIRLIADSCQNLKKLSLRVVIQIDSDDLIHVIDRLGEQLTTLVLDGYNISDDAYSYLSNCPRLQELEISSNGTMTDIGLLEGIGSLHELTSLQLTGGYGFSAEALTEFLHRPSMASIVLLTLSGCYSLDDEGLEGIAERCIHLKELTISEGRDVSDDGLSMVICNCNQLRVLNLWDLRFVTGEFLVLVPSHLPHLRELYLGYCHRVCDKYVEELVAAVPELKVIKR